MRPAGVIFGTVSLAEVTRSPDPEQSIVSLPLAHTIAVTVAGVVNRLRAGDSG
jgi:hypothetical protein